MKTENVKLYYYVTYVTVTGSFDVRCAAGDEEPRNPTLEGGQKLLKFVAKLENQKVANTIAELCNNSNIDILVEVGKIQKNVSPTLLDICNELGIEYSNPKIAEEWAKEAFLSKYKHSFLDKDDVSLLRKTLKAARGFLGHMHMPGDLSLKRVTTLEMKLLKLIE